MRTVQSKIQSMIANDEDYFMHNGTMYVSYPDGVYIVPSDTVDLHNPASKTKVE